jgi:DNA polymerase I
MLQGSNKQRDAGRSVSPLQWGYREIWLVDFEFNGVAGDLPSPVCLVAHELRTGRVVRLRREEMGSQPPYALDDRCLFVAFFASAELGCHLALNWPLPRRVLDLYAEFRCLTNSSPVHLRSLIHALQYFGLDIQSLLAKDGMRDLILQGGPWTAEQRRGIIDYCEADVVALRRLLDTMAGAIDLARALLRGRYMSAVARMEHNGIPIDTDTLADLMSQWPDIQQRLIQRIDREYGVYDGTTFKSIRFERWLASQRMSWPRLQSGRLDLSDEAFREMARVHRKVSTLHELRSTLARLRTLKLEVGADGRGRTLLSPFSSITGRNQPSTTRFIFGPSTWVRSLIKPPAGNAIAYMDWEQQEFGIAAALSADPQMRAAYLSGDPYLTFAKQAGAVPHDATKVTHNQERELFKSCALAVQYGMGEESLARRIGRSRLEARNLLRLHRQTYRTFWAWSDRVFHHAILTGTLETAFGWKLQAGGSPNERSLRNFPMQANGAEMLRSACAIATERGIKVCAPVHDAILVEAELGLIDAVVADMQSIMAEASRLVLGDFELRSDVKVVHYPNRFMDERGRRMWDTIMALLGEQQDVGLAA